MEAVQLVVAVRQLAVILGVARKREHQPLDDGQSIVLAVQRIAARRQKMQGGHAVGLLPQDLV